jgi:hypothetical protein
MAVALRPLPYLVIVVDQEVVLKLMQHQIQVHQELLVKVELVAMLAAEALLAEGVGVQAQPEVRKAVLMLQVMVVMVLAQA